MAKMYPLFLGLLLTALCFPRGIGHPVLEETSSGGEAASFPENKIDPIVSSLRVQILQIAEREIGVKEATGNNDGERVEEYLRYTHLGRGYAWCAAFVSWCYGQAGLPEPRNPWSPALFPSARTYCKGRACEAVTNQIRKADVFGIYGAVAKRINHVGLVRKVENVYLITVEGNSNNRVESRRRHLKTIYALSDWITNDESL